MNTPSVTEASIPILQELVERYRKLYEGPEIDAKLERLSRGGSPGRTLCLGHTSPAADVTLGLLRHPCGSGVGSSYGDICAV